MRSTGVLSFSVTALNLSPRQSTHKRRLSSVFGVKRMERRGPARLPWRAPMSPVRVHLTSGNSIFRFTGLEAHRGFGEEELGSLPEAPTQGTYAHQHHPETAMSPPKSQCLCNISAAFAIRGNPCLVPQSQYLRAVVITHSLAPQSLSTSDEARKMAVWEPTSSCFRRGGHVQPFSGSSARPLGVLGLLGVFAVPLDVASLMPVAAFRVAAFLVHSVLRRSRPWLGCHCLVVGCPPRAGALSPWWSLCLSTPL